MGCSGSRAVVAPSPPRPPPPTAALPPHTKSARTEAGAASREGHEDASVAFVLQLLPCELAAREAVSGQRIIRLIASDAVHAAPAGSIQGSAGREAGKGLRWPAATGAYNFKTMRQRVRNALEKGYTVPHATRWYVYQHLTGGLEIEAHFPGLYKLLLQVGPAPPSADTVIRCDVHRTMPTIPFFGSRFQPGPGQSQLYRILTAYAHLDPEVCYTQGMAFIVALLLLTGMREQAAFYAFAGLMLRFGLRHFFGNGLHLTLLAHKVLTRLLEHAAPVLAAKLEEAMVLPPAYATQWLMTMFVSSPLPPSTILTILDRIMLDELPAAMPPLMRESYTYALSRVLRANPGQPLPPLLPCSPPARGTARTFFGAATPAPHEARTASRIATVRARRGAVHRLHAVDDPASNASESDAPSTPNPASAPVLTVADIPPIMLQACLALVLAHEADILASEPDFSMFGIIKDSYDRFSWQVTDSMHDAPHVVPPSAPLDAHGSTLLAGRSPRADEVSSAEDMVHGVATSGACASGVQVSTVPAHEVQPTARPPALPAPGSDSDGSGSGAHASVLCDTPAAGVAEDSTTDRASVFTPRSLLRRRKRTTHMLQDAHAGSGKPLPAHTVYALQRMASAPLLADVAAQHLRDPMYQIEPEPHLVEYGTAVHCHSPLDNCGSGAVMGGSNTAVAAALTASGSGMSSASRTDSMSCPPHAVLRLASPVHAPHLKSACADEAAERRERVPARLAFDAADVVGEPPLLPGATGIVTSLTTSPASTDAVSASSRAQRGHHMPHLSGFAAMPTLSSAAATSGGASRRGLASPTILVGHETTRGSRWQSGVGSHADAQLLPQPTLWLPRPRCHFIASEGVRVDVAEQVRLCEAAAATARRTKQSDETLSVRHISLSPTSVGAITPVGTHAALDISPSPMPDPDPVAVAADGGDAASVTSVHHHFAEWSCDGVPASAWALPLAFASLLQTDKRLHLSRSLLQKIQRAIDEEATGS